MLPSHCRSFRLLFALLPLLCHEVVANTEIINFSSTRERTVDLPVDVVGNWSKLDYADNERRWTLEPAALHTPLHQVCETGDTTVPSHPPFSCPHELWLFLDLDDEKWASYSTFTLRLSWAASTPADFSIEIYSPETLLARLSNQHQISTGPESTHTSRSFPHKSTTRSKYARIRAVNAGSPTPTLTSSAQLRLLPFQTRPETHPHPQHHVVSVPHPDSGAPADLAVELHTDGSTRRPLSMPFIVILEPLYLGVLPASLLPTVGFLIPIVLVAAWSVSRVIAYLDTFVRQAREDLNNARTALENKGR